MQASSNERDSYLQIALSNECKYRLPLRTAIDAVRENNVLSLMEMLASGYDVNECTLMNWTPLHVACHSRASGECLRVLLEHPKVAVNARTAEHFYTPMMFAAATNNLVALKMLLEKSADLQLRDRYGSTALHFASCLGSVGVVLLLLHHGADIDAQNCEGNCAADVCKSAAIHNALFTGQLMKVVRTMRKEPEKNCLLALLPQEIMAEICQFFLKE